LHRNIVPQKKIGTEPFHVAGSPLPFTVQDFWATAFSGLVTNMTRGILAEYLVCKALGLTDQVMNDYDSYDAITPDGKRIEVKSSGYIQRWSQKGPSRIVFSIGKKFAYDYEAQVSEKDSRRHSDIYVFACHHHMDKGTVDPLDLSQWTFYVVPTVAINEKFPEAKSVSLAAIVNGLNPFKTDFAGLRAAIENTPLLHPENSTAQQS
jgi:hypothetical protein